MKTFFCLLLFISINLNAYCIFNQTNHKLLFMVEYYPKGSDSIFVFKEFIKPNEKRCCKIGENNCNPSDNKKSKLSFYAFFNEKAIEGCDIFGLSDSNITLSSYQVFDNCIWK